LLAGLCISLGSRRQATFKPALFDGAMLPRIVERLAFVTLVVLPPVFVVPARPPITAAVNLAAAAARTWVSRLRHGLLPIGTSCRFVQRATSATQARLRPALRMNATA
jgi:hypothetical protein